MKPPMAAKHAAALLVEQAQLWSLDVLLASSAIGPLFWSSANI